MADIQKRVVFETPGPGTIVYGTSYYVEPTGGRKRITRATEIQDDLTESTQVAYSDDHGKTWSDLQEVPCSEQTPQGMRRWTYLPGWIDPVNGRLLEVGNEAVLPNDHALDAMKHMFLKYRVSTDGGRSWCVDQRMIQTGDYTPERPMDGVHIGHNGMMLGDQGSTPIRTQSGRIIVPGMMFPVGEDGNYCNPFDTHTYSDIALVYGQWRDDCTIDWQRKVILHDDKGVSTRGLIEPTLATLPDGRLLMIIRGSNQKRPDLPGRKWKTISADDGDSWASIEPWTYDDGEAFNSPSSMSLLLEHSNGEIYWFGNITDQAPQANGPRYPLVMGRVDKTSLCLVRDSVVAIDNRQPDEPESMTLSNFHVHEDRQTGEVIVHMTRTFFDKWMGTAYEYRITV